MMTQKTETKQLTFQDFEFFLGEKLSEFVKGNIEKYDFKYSEISLQEEKALLIRIIETLTDKQLEFSGEHRHLRWESGWRENFDEFKHSKNDTKSLIPHYFGKIPYVRIAQRWIKVESNNFEYHCLAVILDWIFEKYCEKANFIYEFGCGTGHNLVRLRGINKNATLWGLDWAKSSQDVIKTYSEINGDIKLNGYNFDYFKPDYNFKIEKNGIIYTVASLEQIGSNHTAFTDYLISQNPKLCIHIEPIGEILEKDNLLDVISNKYFIKRNYLNGFLTNLEKLENDGKIQIHEVRRTNIGSFYIEGYTIIIWSIKN